MNTLAEKKLTCHLCSNPLSRGIVCDGDRSFCCHGCLAVFNVLSAKNELDDYQSHPLFRQAVMTGIVSNPDLIESAAKKDEASNGTEIVKIHLEIQEMWCPSCSFVIRYFLLKQKGVVSSVVDYATDLASVEYQPRMISRERIYKLIEKLGYKPVSLKDPLQNKIGFINTLRFAIAAFCTLNVMMFSYPLYATYFNQDTIGAGPLFAWFSFFASLPVVTFSAYPIYRKCLASLRVGKTGMETLVVLAVFASFLRSFYELLHDQTHVYFDSMTVIVTLVLLGKMLESKSKFSAKTALFRLMRSVPKRGRKRFDDGHEKHVLLKDLEKGDLLVVLKGEKIPLDGVVVDGGGSCDESLITGESFPVRKQSGDLCIAGALLIQGWVCIQAAKSADETFLTQIIEMIEKDVGKKQKSPCLVDKLTEWFVPMICAISILSFFTAVWMGASVNDAFIRTVSVLLISCPCAIGIAQPLVEACMINFLAERGVLVRNRSVLFSLGGDACYIFDKTGTLTKGKFQIISGMETLSDSQKSKLKGLCSKSSHPVSCAIDSSLNIEPQNFEYVEDVAGRGVKSEECLLGSEQFLKENGILVHEVKSEDPFSLAFFAINGKLVSAIALGDKLKDKVDDQLQKIQGKRVLLSGDSKNVVHFVAQKLAFDVFYHGKTPLEKREIVEKSREPGRIVCMIGDGINDAPALAAADVSVSVVNASDMSVQVSDVLLTSDSLEPLIYLQKIAKKGKRVVRQNLFWAFFYNVFGVGLAFFGLLSPLFSAFAMVASSLFVTYNARRVTNLK